MNLERLADDTMLCLAATAQLGLRDLSRAQRELLKAVSQFERVKEIVHQARLPERLAKRELSRLIELGLVAYRDDDASTDELPIYEPPARDSEVRGLGSMVSATSRSHGASAAPTTSSRGVSRSRQGGAVRSMAPAVSPKTGSPSLDPNATPDPRPTPLHQDELEAAFDRLQSRPFNTLAGGGGSTPPPPRNRDERTSGTRPGGVSRATDPAPPGPHKVPRGASQQPSGTFPAAQGGETPAVDVPPDTSNTPARGASIVPSTLPNGTPATYSLGLKARSSWPPPVVTAAPDNQAFDNPTHQNPAVPPALPPLVPRAPAQLPTGQLLTGQLPITGQLQPQRIIQARNRHLGVTLQGVMVPQIPGPPALPSKRDTTQHTPTLPAPEQKGDRVANPPEMPAVVATVPTHPAPIAVRATPPSPAPPRVQPVAEVPARADVDPAAKFQTESPAVRQATANGENPSSDGTPRSDEAAPSVADLQPAIEESISEDSIVKIYAGEGAPELTILEAEVVDTPEPVAIDPRRGGISISAGEPDVAAQRQPELSTPGLTADAVEAVASPVRPVVMTAEAAERRPDSVTMRSVVEPAVATGAAEGPPAGIELQPQPHSPGMTDRVDEQPDEPIPVAGRPAPVASGFDELKPDAHTRSRSSRPPPRVSGFEALKPDGDTLRQPLEMASGAGPADVIASPPVMAIPRVTVPGDVNTEQGPGHGTLAGETIPLVRVVRSRMITLGKSSDGSPDAATGAQQRLPSGTMPMELTKSATDRGAAAKGALPGAMTNGSTIAGMPSQHPASRSSAPALSPPAGTRTSTPLGATLGGMAPVARGNGDSGSGDRHSSNPASAEPKSGETLEGMPAQTQRPPSSESQTGRTFDGMPSLPPEGPHSSPVANVRGSIPSQIRSGNTLESMPAPPHDGGAGRVPQLPGGLGASTAAGTTLLGGTGAPRLKSRGRTSVVVRAGSPSSPDKTPTPAARSEVATTGRTLVGVLAPTHDERNEHLARGANSGPQATDPDGGNQHASSENDDSSTSTTMPSLRSHRLRDAQDQRAGHDSDGEDSAVFPRSSAHASHARGADAHNFGNEDQLDHYQVLECLAKGGSGVVYLVKEPNAASDQLLALKVLRQGNHKIIEAVESLNREARLMDALRHPNLVALSHFGHENGEPFLLMEYVEGLSMSELLQHPVPLPLDVGLIVIQDALEALDYVHHAQVEGLAGGLVHCDVSPQNLLVGSDGRTRLIDFGTSREPGESLGDAAVRCKPRYSSPEMMAGDAVGPQSDIFSMGAVLFQLLSKQPAFSADPKRRKKESLVPNPSMLNRRAPTPLDPVCQRALDPDSCERYSSAREMLEALDAAVDQAGIELRRQRVNFWVRRVLQSRQGDVEFDMNELEDLLDSKPPARASGNAGEFTAVREEVVAGPPSSGEEHTQDVEPTKGRSVPPPAVEQRLARRRVDELQSGASPSSESRIGAASRFVSGRDDSQLSLKTRMTITGIAIGIAIALLIFALIKPDIFKSWFPVQQEPDWSGERRRSPEAVPDPRVSAEERAKRLREKIRAAAEAEPTQGSPLANEPEAEPAAPAADRAGDRVAESESERLEERATTARNRAAPKITAVPKSESTAEAKPAPERAARQPKTQRAPAAETRLPTEAEPPAEQAATATPEPSPRPQPAPTMEIEAAPETEASKSKPPPGTPPPPKPNPEVGSGLPNAPSVAAKPKSPTTTSPAPVTPRTEARPRTPQIGPITPP